MIAMPRQTASAVVAALLVTLLLAAGCGQVPEDSGDGEVEIRAYKVPEGMDVDQLRTSLAQSLGSGNEMVGTVFTYPDGSVVVTAPASVQAGVEALIEQMRTAGPGKIAEAQTVAIDYWIVVGRPDVRSLWPGTDENGKLFNPYEDAQAKRDLSGIVPALEQIRAAQGPMIFRLLEKQRLTSVSSGETSRINGRFASVEQRVRTLGSGKWLVDIEMRVGNQHIQTRASLEPGKFIVLGETGLRNRDFPLLEASDDENLMLYYVISADID